MNMCVHTCLCVLCVFLYMCTCLLLTTITESREKCDPVTVEQMILLLHLSVCLLLQIRVCMSVIIFFVLFLTYFCGDGYM